MKSLRAEEKKMSYSSFDQVPVLDIPFLLKGFQTSHSGWTAYLPPNRIQGSQRGSDNNAIFELH
jgi:hypothetical protein